MDNRFEMFTMLVNRISRSIRKIKIQEMADYGLRSTHISCLYYLYISNGLTATDLCERCEEDKAAISRALDYLETEGYLTCEAQGVKRYRSLLTLTDKGREVGRIIADKICGVLDAIGQELSDEERQTLYRSLFIISERLAQLAQGTGKKEV